MTTESKRGLLIGSSLVLVMSAGIVLGIIYYLDSSSGHRTATAPVEIVNAVPTSWSDSSKTKKYGFRVSYRFIADGQTISGVDEKNMSYREGEQFRVCYDPKNPSDKHLRSSGGMDCAKKILF